MKQEAQKTASDLGLSLSSVVKALLKQFIRTKSLAVDVKERPEIPNAYFRKVLKQSEEDIKEGRVISFKTPDDAIAYVSSLIDHDENHPTPKH